MVYGSVRQPRSPMNQSINQSNLDAEIRLASKSDGEGSPATVDDSVGTLRKERDAREGAERSRAAVLLVKAVLLAKADAEMRPGWKKSSRGRYSNQFAHM